MPINENDIIGYGPSTEDSSQRHSINHLPEEPTWEPEIYRLETNDYVVGGGDGVANLQARQLAHRTAWLKKRAEDLERAINAIQPGTDRYDELIAMIRALDATTTNNRLNHLERLMANAYLAFEMAQIDPDGYDGMIIETFDGNASQIDQAVTVVTSVVSGDDSIDVDDSTNLIIGAHYQLTDGEKIEEVQVKSINISGAINRVILASNVQKQYTAGRAKLYRSSVAIFNGRAYGGGNTSTQDIEVNETFSGSDTTETLTAAISFEDPSAFELVGGHIEDGRIVMGTASFGIALNAYGNPATGWKQINADCDDLTQADLG